MKPSLLYALILPLICCTIHRTSEVESANSKIVLTAKKLFEKNYNITNNKDNSYAIVTKKSKKLADLFPEIEYFIFDYQLGKIIFQDTLKAGHVSWISNNEVKAIARNLPKENSSSSTKVVYYFNVKTRKKRK